MSIRELREAVEAGRCDHDMFCPMFHSQGLCTECEAAFHGSLDAAKRLHDALLPGWTAVEIRSRGARTRWVVDLSRLVHEVEEFATGRDKDAARAYLIAILRALEEEGRDG